MIFVSELISLKCYFTHSEIKLVLLKTLSWFGWQYCAEQFPPVPGFKGKKKKKDIKLLDDPPNVRLS